VAVAIGFEHAENRLSGDLLDHPEVVPEVCQVDLGSSRSNGVRGDGALWPEHSRQRGRQSRDGTAKRSEGSSHGGRDFLVQPAGNRRQLPGLAGTAVAPDH
jgi:hypothetical protein